jgi:hypothetical protein
LPVVKPTARDVVLLLALQVCISALGAGILALLPFNAGPGSWVGGLGIMVGAQSFVVFKARKHPDAFDGGAYSHRLALYAALGQLALGGLAAVGIAVAAPQVLDSLGVGTVVFILVVAGLAGLLTYGLTRWGFRMGLSALARGRKGARS